MSLSTLIVQREIASIREVEEALARQVLYGGDLVTNLLEVCRIDEAQLLPIVAESLGLAAAPSGELPRPDPDAKRLVAAEVASQRNLAPLSVDRYGLVLAVAAPLPPEVEQELSFALAMPISTKVAPLVRIRQALTRDYGLPLEKRFQRLLQRMMSPGPRTSSSFPPMRAIDSQMGAPRPPSAQPPAPHNAPVLPVRPSVDPDGGARTLVRTSAPAGSMRPARRRRGAITVDDAKAELEEATERDGIFDLLFEFARQYFDYTAVFVVHGEIAEGRDAFGEGAPRDRVARIGVPLDMASILAAARTKKAKVQRVPAEDGLDAILMSDLGRPGRTLCVVLPVIVRGRVVALLLGDGGEAGIDQKTLGDVEGIVALASGAFERLIVRRKLKGTLPPGQTESMIPGGASLAPPTKVSEVSNRPSAEELAPPIRELMNEPMSFSGDTMRQPPAHALVSPASTTALAAGEAHPEAPGTSSQQPPPPNLLSVRRPSGAPIPREEPQTQQRMPAVTAPSNLAGYAEQAHTIVYGDATAPPPSAPPRSRRRGEAPKLDFQSVPSSSSSLFGSDAFAADDVERQLLAEIHGRAAQSIPASDAGETTLVSSSSIVPEQVSTVSGTSSASGDDEATQITTSPLSTEVEPPLSPMEPMAPHADAPIVPFPSTIITDPSPALPMFVPYDGPPSGVESDPVTPREPERDFSDELAPIPPSSTQVLSAHDSDVSLVDPDYTPVTPMVDMDGLTPIHPPVSAAPFTVQVSPYTSLPGSSTAVSPRQAPLSEGRVMPPSEQVISVPAHRPPSSRNQNQAPLPSVIVDVSSEYVDLVDRVIGGRIGAEDAENELLRAGGHAMPAIMARFPGPITIEAERLYQGPLPRVSEGGPVIRLVASQRRTALPFVMAHVADTDGEKRFWATYLLMELPYPDVLEAILSRVFDEQPRIRRVARAAARAFADAHPGIIAPRLDLVASDAGELRDRRIIAVETLGDTREVSAIASLIPLLDDRDPEIASAARASLVVVARQDFGTATQKWSLWWSQHHDRHRIEWLIDALMHDQAAIRAAAGEELKTTTKEYFGYYDDLPKRERERAQSRYREWWNTIGRVRFSRSSSSRS